MSNEYMSLSAAAKKAGSGLCAIPLSQFVQTLIDHEKLRVVGEITTVAAGKDTRQHRTRYAGEWLIERGAKWRQDIHTKEMFADQFIHEDAIQFVRDIVAAEWETKRIAERAEMERRAKTKWRNCVPIERPLSEARKCMVVGESQYSGPLKPQHEGVYPWDMNAKTRYQRNALCWLNGGYNFVS